MSAAAPYPPLPLSQGILGTVVLRGGGERGFCGSCCVCQVTSQSADDITPVYFLLLGGQQETSMTQRKT